MAEQAAKVPPKSWSASQELSLHPTASQSRTVTERDNSLENGVQDLKKRKESIRAKRTSTESKGENVQSCQSSIPKSDYPVQGQIQQPGQDKYVDMSLSELHYIKLTTSNITKLFLIDHSFFITL